MSTASARSPHPRSSESCIDAASAPRPREGRTLTRIPESPVFHRAQGTAMQTQTARSVPIPFRNASASSPSPTSRHPQIRSPRRKCARLTHRCQYIRAQSPDEFTQCLRRVQGVRQLLGGTTLLVDLKVFFAAARLTSVVWPTRARQTEMQAGGVRLSPAQVSREKRTAAVGFACMPMWGADRVRPWAPSV